jgi:hypothetical protein
VVHSQRFGLVFQLGQPTGQVAVRCGQGARNLLVRL